MNNPLLNEQARQFRNQYDIDSEERSMALGGLQAKHQTKMNNSRAAAMAMASPQWGAVMQGLRNAGGGKRVDVGFSEHMTAPLKPFGPTTPFDGLSTDDLINLSAMSRADAR